MKKSQMCFPLSIISAIAIIATGVLFISLDWNEFNEDDSSFLVCITSGAGLVFAIASLIRAKVEKDNPSTLRSTGILIGLICMLIGIGAMIFGLDGWLN